MNCTYHIRNHWWEQEVKAFSEKLKDEIEKMQSFSIYLKSYSRVQPIQQDDFVYEKKEDLYDILASLKDLDASMFNIIIGILKDQIISNIKGFLEREDTRKHFNVNNQERQKIINVIRNINEHDFNRNDYSTDKYLNTKKELINRIRDDKNIINLTAIDSKFIQCGSNSLNLLVEMKADLKNHNFENIRIKNTSLIGSNFVRCNMNGSEFDNINIIWMNMNGAILFNCKWKNMKIHELNQLDGHSDRVNSVCFSPDGTTLASGSGNPYNESNDNSIRLWDVKTGQQKSKLDGHSNTVYSVCFSPDGNTLASGSNDKSIRLWDVKTGKEIQSSDKNSKDILAQFKTPLFQNNPLPEISTNITIVLISQTPIFQAQGAFILQGEFINYQGVDLRSLLKSKGSCILENYLELQSQ